MSPRHVRPARELLPRINTRASAKAKQLNTGSTDTNQLITEDPKTTKGKRKSFGSTALDFIKGNKRPSKNTINQSMQKDGENIFMPDVAGEKRINVLDALSGLLNITKVKESKAGHILRKRTSDDQSPSVLTPKNSPIAVNLTPHRSSKTPKKSPKNWTSPKTAFSVTPLRLAKTPRKLPLSTESPKPLGKSRTTARRVDSTGYRSSSLSNSINTVRRFSKSPKIVLRPAKPRWKTSKSPAKLKPKGTRGGMITDKKKKSLNIRNSLGSGPRRSRDDSSSATRAVLDPRRVPVVVLQRLSHVNGTDETLKSINSPVCNASPNGTKAIFSDKTMLEIEKDSEEGNTTYELLQPKTPNLRERCKKRDFKKETSNNQDRKKNWKVRFASQRPSPPTGGRGLAGTKSQSTKSTYDQHGQTISPYMTNRKMSVCVSKPVIKITKPKGTAGKLVQPVSPVVAPRSNSFTRLNTKVSSTPSVFMLDKPEDSRYSSPKKMPNSAHLHKQMFAKSESLVDVKKRIADRHAVLTAASVSNKDKSKKPANRTCLYNRYGFKLRKNDATDYISNKGYAFQLRSKKQQENREILKGVRTNRRFELQMKSRNINH